MLKVITEHPLREHFKQRYRFKRALKCPVQVGLNPKMTRDVRHGTLTFDVSGFGKVEKHFVVNDRDLLAEHSKQFSLKVARQVMLLDKHLPKNEAICTPIQIDIVGNHVRRTYRMPDFTLLLEQAR